MSDVLQVLSILIGLYVCIETMDAACGIDLRTVQWIRLPVFERAITIIKYLLCAATGSTLLLYPPTPELLLAGVTVAVFLTPRIFYRVDARRKKKYEAQAQKGDSNPA